jgi:hypothetical protein
MLFFNFYFVGSLVAHALVVYLGQFGLGFGRRNADIGDQHRHLIFGVIHCVLFGSHRLDGAGGRTAVLDTQDGLDHNGGQKTDPMRPWVPTIGILAGRRAPRSKTSFSNSVGCLLTRPLWDITSGTLSKRGPKSLKTIDA